MLECLVIASFIIDISLRIRLFILLIIWTLKVLSSSLKGKLFLLVSGVEGFRCSRTELSSWVDWIEWWRNSEPLGRDKHSWLLMILLFINYFSITLSDVSLKKSFQISLHNVSFTRCETPFLVHFLFPRFKVHMDATISVSSAFQSIKSEFRQSSVDDVILQCYYLPMYQNLKSDIDFQWKKICGRFSNTTSK